MIIPDINLLVYSYDESSAFHRPAKKWLSSLLNGRQEVGFPLVCLLGFIRLTSNHKVFASPLSASAACKLTQSWLSITSASVIEPGAKHFEILHDLLKDSHATSNLTTDAHIAALALEHQAIIHSNDTDFFRFKTVRCINPLELKTQP